MKMVYDLPLPDELKDLFGPMIDENNKLLRNKGEFMDQRLYSIVVENA